MNLRCRQGPHQDKGAVLLQLEGRGTASHQTVGLASRPDPSAALEFTHDLGGRLLRQSGHARQFCLEIGPRLSITSKTARNEFCRRSEEGSVSFMRSVIVRDPN